MAELAKENSAVRIHRIFERLVAQPDNVTAMVALTNTLELNTKASPLQQAEDLLRSITLLFEELKCLTESLKQRHSDRAYKQVVLAFERFAPPQLVNQWQHSKPLFQQSLGILFVFGESLASEGALVSAEDLKNLRDAVTKFGEETDASELPEELKRFVAQQVDIILRAVNDYRIAGIKAFKTGVKDMYFHHAENNDVVQKNAGTEQMSRLKSFFVTISQWSKFPVETGKLLSAGDSIYTHGEKALHAAAQATQHVAGVVHNLK